MHKFPWHNISSDIDNVSEIRNSKTYKELKNSNYCKRLQTPLSRYNTYDRNIRRSDEILKFIADHSGIN